MPALISLLLPTRGRPPLAHRFLRSVAEQSVFPQDVEIIMYADEDDVASHGIDYPGLKIHRIIGPRQSMGSYNSDCLSASHGGIVALVNDDMVIGTHGWDERLRRFDDSIPDKIYLAYGNDLFKKGSLCTFPILSRRACEVLQEPFPRAYRGAFIDYHLMDVFKRLEHAGYSRIFYLEDVIFEHLHYRTGKAEKDATYTLRGRFDDDMVFIGMVPARAASLSPLIAAIRGTKGDSGPLPACETASKPASAWQAIHLFSARLLGDPMLPLKWRVFLWWWFSARYVASRVL